MSHIVHRSPLPAPALVWLCWTTPAFAAQCSRHFHPSPLRNLCCPASAALRPQVPCPFVRYWRCISIGKYRLAHTDCLLSGIRRSSAILEQLVYFIYVNSNWYIDCCPLYGRCLLLGGPLTEVLLCTVLSDFHLTCIHIHV